jgi:hypothetical protein
MLVVLGCEIFYKLSYYISIKDLMFILDPAMVFIIVSSTILITTKWKDLDNPNLDNTISIKQQNIIYIFVIILALVLRIGNYNYFSGGDNFTLIAARAFNDTGIFGYPRNQNYTYLVAYLFRIFGNKLIVARMPFIIFSLITIYPLFKTASYYGRTIAFISIMLFAISPWSIEKSTQVRDYSENLLFGAIIYAVSFYIFMNNKTFKILKLIFWFVFSSFIVYMYSKIFIQQSILGTLNVNLFLISFMIFIYLIKNKKTGYRIITVIFLFFIGVFFSVIHKVEPFIKGIDLTPDYFLMFFDPKIKEPVQWFSSKYLSLWIPLLFFILPIFDRQKQKDNLRWIVYATFISTTMLFVLKANTFGSRFLYHLLPFYLIIMADGIDTFGKIIFKEYKSKKISFFITITFLLFFLSPLNIIHAAMHDLPNKNDNRRITKLANLNIFYDIEIFMRKHGVNNQSVILVEVQRPDIITWLFSDKVDRIYKIKSYGGVPYDIGNNIYFKCESFGLDETKLALAESEKGFFLTYNNAIPYSDFYIDEQLFVFLGNVDNYKLYSWTK